MVTADAEWDGLAVSTSRTVLASAEALELCAEIEAQGTGQLLVSFTTSTGAFLAIGIGANDSCALFWESTDGPYFRSRGPGTHPCHVSYVYGGQVTSLPDIARIEKASAHAALAQFMTTGERPDVISWDPV